VSASLLLDIVAWDVCLDARGNWALAEDPYAIVQNVSCSCRLVQGEAVFDTTRGVPYFSDIFTGPYPVDLLKSDLEDAALLVNGVEAATVYIQSIVNRQATGQVQVTTPYGPLYASL